MTEKLASIVVRTFNEEKHIGKLLARIEEQNIDPGKYETVVVDSGSTDGTLEIVKSHRTQLVQIPPNEFTFGRSLNRGIEKATGKYILMISAHCYPAKDDWIQQMIAPFQKNNDLALVYGKQRGNETTKFSEKQVFHKYFPETKGGVQDKPFCNNANAAIRKDLWEKHRYDEDLTGLEDLEWAKEMRGRGYDIYYQPSAKIYHIHDETYSQTYSRYKREAIAMKHIFPDSSFPFFDFITMFVSNTLTDYFHAIKERVFLKNAFTIPLFRFAQFFGTYKGHGFKRQITAKVKRQFYYPRKITRKNGEEDYLTIIKLANRLRRWISGIFRIN